MSLLQTTLKNDLTVSLDWLAFTVTAERYTDSYESVARLFGLDPVDFVQAAKGSYGYKVRHEHNTEHISILSDGNDGMGIHVSVSASSLLFFVESFRSTLQTDTPFGTGYDLNNFDSVLQVMLATIADVGSFSRLDIALDDIGVNYYSLDDLQAIFDNPERISTRFRTYGTNLTRDFDETRTKTGHTLSLGSRDSDCYIRIYDKQLEQAKKKNMPASDLPAWVRWEMEIKGHESCMKVVDYLLAGKSLGSIFCGVLGKKMRIIIPDATRKENCSTEELWDKFLCCAEKLSISVPKSQKTLDDKRNWIMQQCSQTISALVQAEYGDMSFLERCIEAGDIRMNSGLRALVNKKHREDLKQQELPFTPDPQSDLDE